MEFALFKDLMVILGFAIFILLIGHRFRIPPVVGFILTGVLAGPHGFGLVSRTEDVDKLAELGIMLLLFGIGMEFSLKKLVQIRRYFLLGGSLQVGLTFALSFIFAYWGGLSLNNSLLLGCLLSMSSTAVAVGILDQRGETYTPHGRLSIAILIFQDMIAIPMLLLIPLLAIESSESQKMNFALFIPLIKGVAFLALVFLFAQRVVPKLLLLVARTRSKELFLLSVLALCFGVAWLTYSVGLSLTIGAFLAGLIISESEYSSEAISNIFPFQALFISFFFVSVGMLLNLNFVLMQPAIIALFAFLFMLVKLITGSLATIVVGLPIRIAIMVGLVMCQVGEFSFVLARIAQEVGLGSAYDYQLFLSASLLTLIISPILMNFSPSIAGSISRVPLPKILKEGFKKIENDDFEKLSNHVIIVGFGVSGRNVAKSCRLAGVGYSILEMNPDTVRDEKKRGEPIHYGDATHVSILQHLRIGSAKTIAILVNDTIAARRIVQIARESNPNLYIIVRARYMQEIELMHKLGADEIIPDEFGTSVEVFSRVLRQYHVPDADIQKFIEDVRADGYELLRNQVPPAARLSDIKLNLSDIEVGSFRLYANSSLIGKALSESQLRHLYGVTVLLIRRENQVISNPSPETRLQEKDVVILMGDKMPLKKVSELFGENRPLI